MKTYLKMQEIIKHEKRPGLRPHLINQTGNQAPVISLLLPRNLEFLPTQLEEVVEWQINYSPQTTGSLFILRLSFLAENRLHRFETYLSPLFSMHEEFLKAMASQKSLPLVIFYPNGELHSETELTVGQSSISKISNGLQVSEAWHQEIGFGALDHYEALQQYRRERFQGISHRSRDLIGEILVDMKVMTQRQLHGLLNAQRHQHYDQPLGNVMLKSNLATPKQITVALTAQKEIRFRQHCLGQILLEEGMISETDLAWVLERQKMSYDPLGVLLIENQICSYAQVQQALKLQKMRRGHRQTLGQILLCNGYIDQEQLEELLAYQTATGEPLGEIAILQGICRTEDIIWATQCQISQSQIAKRRPAPTTPMRQPRPATFFADHLIAGTQAMTSSHFNRKKAM